MEIGSQEDDDANETQLERIIVDKPTKSPRKSLNPYYSASNLQSFPRRAMNSDPSES